MLEPLGTCERADTECVLCNLFQLINVRALSAPSPGFGLEKGVYFILVLQGLSFPSVSHFQPPKPVFPSEETQAGKEPEPSQEILSR